MSDKLRAAAQAALEAITELDGYSRSAVTDKIARDAKQQLRAALAESEPEPVAWQYVWSPGMCFTTDSLATLHNYVQGAEDRLPPEKRGYVRPLYTAPPRREWKRLTDEEIADAIRPLCEENEPVLKQLLDLSMDEYRAIEAALKEKNHVRD